MDDNSRRAPAAVVAKAAPDDAGAFFATEYSMLVKLAMVMAEVGRPEAEDAASETMVEMVRRWEQIEKPTAYARRAVVSHARRRRQRDRERLSREIQGGHTVPECDEQAAMNLWEDSEWVEQMLDELPPAQRQVMEAVLHDFTTREIAGQLGKTEATIRKNLQLARQRLQPLLGRDYQVPTRAEPAQPIPTAREEGNR